MTTIDHSQTYKIKNLKNLPHILRLKRLISTVKEQSSDIDSFCDIGCSNGYITNLIKNSIRPKKTFGLDKSENLEIAKQKYNDINFKKIDLNHIYYSGNEAENNDFNPYKQFDLVTCFETLEHVGNLSNALENLLNFKKDTGILIISVPIEIGFIGVIKYLLKRYIYKYELELNCNEKDYFFDLIRNNDISKHRKECDGFGTHFGFDYRKIDNFFTERSIKFMAYKYITTKIYIIT